MIVGRTASNAIKIKTDGTTRAVNCACCGGGCSCGAVKISEPLLSTIRNATTATCNGNAPSYWNNNNDFLRAYWVINNNNAGAIIYDIYMQNGTNCFYAGGDIGCNVLSAGKSEGCCSSPFSTITCSDDTFTINGITFPSNQIKFNECPDETVPRPNFVFS